jgi:hypothetical protein
MQLNTPRHVYWTYSYGFNGKKDFIDPRIPIARHIGWKKSTSEFADYPTPEPDNYNRAVFTTKLWECPLVEDQVVYYDQNKQGWMIVLYVPQEDIVEVDRWIYHLPTIAVWRHLKPPKIKPQRSLLWTRGNISDTNQTDNERLYTMGYFDELKVKYFSDDAAYVDSLLGEARAILKDPWPEAEETEVDDF